MASRIIIDLLSDSDDDIAMPTQTVFPVHILQDNEYEQLINILDNPTTRYRNNANAPRQPVYDVHVVSEIEYNTLAAAIDVAEQQHNTTRQGSMSTITGTPNAVSIPPTTRQQIQHNTNRNNKTHTSTTMSPTTAQRTRGQSTTHIMLHNNTNQPPNQHTRQHAYHNNTTHTITHPPPQTMPTTTSTTAPSIPIQQTNTMTPYKTHNTTQPKNNMYTSQMQHSTTRNIPNHATALCKRTKVFHTASTVTFPNIPTQQIQYARSTTSNDTNDNQPTFLEMANELDDMRQLEQDEYEQSIQQSAMPLTRYPSDLENERSPKTPRSPRTT
jgi:hypothetical protein